jgi:D-serine deaminase-like pyridoxal phosphate-dependent protein
VDVFIEIDVGHHRCGVPTGPLVLVLAQEIGRHALLRFAGLQAYHGSAQHLCSASDRHDTIAAAVEHVKVARCLLESHGVAVGLVTGVGTGTFANEARSGVWNELQTGSFLFMDGHYSRNELDADQPHFEHALFVKSQVMSESGGHVMCDAGHKSHAVDCGMPLVCISKAIQFLRYWVRTVACTSPITTIRDWRW